VRRTRHATRTAVVALAALLVVGCTTNTYLGRWVWWNLSDVEDYKRFPAEPVSKAPPVFHFRAGTRSPALTTVEYEEDDGIRAVGLHELLESSETTAFIVIRDDAILVEEYLNGYSRDSINTSFSVAKSITSLLVGIAIDEGAIESADDPVSKYLPELARRDARYAKVTLAHLLDMKSGIRYRDHDLPWGDKAKAYYHPELRKLVMDLDLVGEPGAAWQYNTYNPILLGLVLERATGRSVPKYFEEKLWKPLGMEYDASWSLDSAGDGMAKMESGINARAIDFAKLGRLVLERGRWQGRTIVSERWIAESTALDATDRVPEMGEGIYYRHAWWLHAPSATRRYAVAGWGHLGQYLYIFPDESLVMVRFGKETGDVPWPRVCQALAAQLASRDRSR